MYNDSSIFCLKGDKFMIIDGHAHACGTYNSSDDILNYLDKCNIDAVVLCAGEPHSKKNYNLAMLSDRFESSNLGYFFNKIICIVTKLTGVAKHTDTQNKYIYELSKEYPARIINTYWVNPLDNNCMEKLQKDFILYNFKMIKLHQCWNLFDIQSAKAIEIFEWATHKHIPIFIHLRSHEQVIKFIEITNHFQDLTFIVAHMIGFEKISKNSKNSNIYFDLSAPQLYPFSLMKKALETVGSTKLIMGSDTPYGIDNITRIMDRLNQLSLSKEEKDNIKGNNLANIFKLEN